MPHKRLISKLKAYGLEGRIIKWIQEFLSNRKQQVKLRGKLSNWADILSGVPQGSVLGAILLVLYINDLPDIVTSTSKLFADDTKLYNKVSKGKYRWGKHAAARFAYPGEVVRYLFAEV